MSAPRRVVASMLLLTLSSCASQPTYGPADDQALEPTRKSYQACLEKETRSLIDGSDDVQFLTQHIVQQCDPALTPAATYLRRRGFSDWYVGSFLQEKRQHAMRATADFILRVKSLQNGGGDAPSSPQASPYF